MKYLFKNLKAIATLNEYGKCTSPRQNLNSGKRVTKLRQLQLGVLSFIGVASVLLLPNSVRAATTTLNFNDSSPNLVSGTALSLGAVYRFKNVATGVDALVTIAQISNSQLLILDDNTDPNLINRFQPTIRQIGASQTSYIRFDFQLVVSGTTTPTSVPNVYFSAQDVDGNGVANGVQEFVELINSQVSYVANPTFLTNVSALAGGVRYQITNSSNVQNGIGTDDQYEFYSYVGTSVSNFSVIGGSSSGTATTCNTNNTACQRQNSWTFNIIDVQPLDFGDAPSSYGNASHPVPPTPTVYFGAAVDGDDAPNYSTNADGDDTAGTDDEDGVASFPALTTSSTTYSVTATCKGTNKPVAAWIDFNRNGVFDTGERTSGTCNNTSVTLNWTGLSGLSAGKTYARFRIASNAAEITSPSTTASDGEVEDYSLSITTSISGIVFDDADGSKIQNGAETATNAGGINAVLVDSSSKVVATTAVAADGSYTFSNVPANANYTVQITTATATVGAAPPAITLPSGWISTGENLSGVVDGTVDSKISVNVTTTNVTGVNFGIERLPDTTALSPASQTNPGGTTTVQIPTLAGTDPEDGALGSGKTFKIVTLPTNGTLTYNGTAVTAGQTISNYNPTLLKVDPNDGTITVSFTYAAIDAAGKEDPTPATVTMPFTASPVSISGTVFSDADADVTINGSDGGTNAGSATLTIYALDTSGKVLDKATVAATGTYSLTNIPANSSVALRLSNDSTVAIGATAPTASSIPSGWYYTGENKNGTIDGTIATLGNIALTTTTSNLTNENFGIRQAYTITADPAPTTCNPDYRTALNTGITAAGGQLAVGANDLNWTAEWIAGPASGIGTPYATPRPVGPMPAVVIGNLASGAWVNEPANARWISYPFGLSTQNANGKHNDADLDGRNGEDGSGIAIVGTSDVVRLKFTSQLTLPSNANTISISLPLGVAIDNQFASIKVNGVENLVPTPAPNSQAADYGSFKTVNITNGWQAGVNTIEIVMDSGPPLAGFLLSVQATSTQVCGKSNVVLVKRITAINGVSTINPSDNTTHLDQVLDNPATPNDDATVKWPSGYLVGAFNAGKIKPGDVLEYTVYFLNAKGANANTVKICDRIIGSQTYKTSSLEIRLGNATSSISLSDAADPALDRGQFYPSSASAPAACNLITPGTGVADNGTWAVDVMGTGSSAQPDFTTMPSATAPGTPTASYGFIRFKTIVNP